MMLRRRGSSWPALWETRAADRQPAPRLVLTLGYAAMCKEPPRRGSRRGIATGVIEGACRHIVADRFDVTGARWSLAGALPRAAGSPFRRAAPE